MIEINCELVKTNIDYIDDDWEVVEVYYNPANTAIKGLEKGGKIKHYNILNDQEI